MPNKPAQDLNVNPLMNDKQAAMLNGISDELVEEEDLSLAAVPGAAALPVDLSKQELRFFSLFQNTNANANDQTSVPEDMDLGLINAPKAGRDLPQVSMTPEELEARVEDKARREAYMAEYAKQEQKDQKKHDRYLKTFDSLKGKR